MVRSNGTRWLVARTVLFGVVSVISFGAAFMHQEVAVSWCSRGGWFAVLPIAAGFYFSVVHGCFASNLLELVGFRAADDQCGRK